jgi:hypothetical protein
MKKFLACILAALATFAVIWMPSPALAVPGFSWSTSTLSIYPSQCASTVTNSYRNPANSRNPIIRIPGRADVTNIQEMREQVPGVFFGQGFDNDTGISIWCTPTDLPLCSRTVSSLIILAVSDRGNSVARAAVDRLRGQIGSPNLIDCSA